MEILILGLILVGLMVYLSTRIKRTAAAAYLSETIETPEYVIEKPDGFLNVVGGDDKYAFEAYSKDYGEDEAARYRAANAFLTVSNGRSMDEVVTGVEADGDEIIDVTPEVIGSFHYRVIEAKRNSDGVGFEVLYKIAERGDQVYKLEVVRLAETSPQTKRKTETFINSFELR